MKTKQSVPKFELRYMEEIVGRQQFFELLIDGTGCVVAFEAALKGTTYQSELTTALAYMDKVANLHSLPQSKFKDITPKGEHVREYEFKTKHLRDYAVQKPGGKVIVLAGFKKTQAEDIQRMRRLKQEIEEELVK